MMVDTETYKVIATPILSDKTSVKDGTICDHCHKIKLELEETLELNSAN
jgi:hypothetical protein